MVVYHIGVSEVGIGDGEKCDGGSPGQIGGDGSGGEEISEIGKLRV